MLGRGPDPISFLLRYKLWSCVQAKSAQLCWVPDRPFHNSRAFKSLDGLFRTATDVEALKLQRGWSGVYKYKPYTSSHNHYASAD